MKKLVLTVGIFALPLVSFAQLGNVSSLIQAVGNIINMLVPIMFTLALLIFFWGLVKFIWGAAEGKDDAKKFMIWGVVVLFVMSAVWGLVRFIGNAVGVNEQSGPNVQNLLPR